MLNAVLSLLVLAAIALLLGAFLLWRKGAPLKQVALMVVLVIVIVANVLIWTVPDADGVAPAQKSLISGP